MKYLRMLSCIAVVILSSTLRSSAQYKSDLLEIEPLTQHIYVHTSFLETSGWGKVACNGLIYIRNGEALIFDTPAVEKASIELLNWVENTIGAKVKGVVVNHFHDDCLAGLNVFHKAGVESYSSKRTREYAESDSVNAPAVPRTGFDRQLILKVGNQRIVNRFFGEGHTRDNIVSYIPSEKVMFGGCLIKEAGAGKGNLADANVAEWPITLKKVKKEYSQVQIVVPGHGKPGDSSLLDYTIELFEGH